MGKGVKAGLPLTQIYEKEIADLFSKHSGKTREELKAEGKLISRVSACPTRKAIASKLKSFFRNDKLDKLGCRGGNGRSAAKLGGCRAVAIIDSS